MLLDKRIFSNLFSDWILALATAIFVFLFTEAVIALLRRRIGAPEGAAAEPWKAFLGELIVKISPWLLLIFAIYFGSRWLDLPANAERGVEKAAAFALLLQCALLGSRGIQFWIGHYRAQKLEANAGTVTTISSVGFVLRILLWVIVLLIALDNLGVNITTLVAGLGIGGIAVALAVQNILGDLFASFSIVLDKPFIIGDFIVVDTFMGTVEHIGLKTTRVRSLSGELLIFSNTDLLKSRIRNFKQMQERRAVFTIGVTYETPIEKIEAIPGMLQKIIEAQSPVRFDRAHFKGYGPYSLDFETVFWVNSPDYTLYMDIQQAINLELFRRFEEEGIEFAYPTQTLHFKDHAGDGSGGAQSSVFIRKKA